jgi:hypothetical protein
VLCERTASDILSHQIETDNKVGLPGEAVFVATKQVHSQFKTVARPRAAAADIPLIILCLGASAVKRKLNLWCCAALPRRALT